MARTPIKDVSPQVPEPAESPQAPPEAPEAPVPIKAGQSDEAQLYAALARAQQSIRQLPKDSENKHHRYYYTSMESLIREGRRCLSMHGLALIRLGWHIPPDEIREAKNGQPFPTLSDFRLVHACGAHIDFVGVAWIGTPNKGMAADKALAAALTNSLGYFMRDLLLIDRPDEASEQMDKRDDSAYDPKVLGQRAQIIENELLRRDLSFDALRKVLQQATGREMPEDMRQWPSNLFDRISDWCVRATRAKELADRQKAEKPPEATEADAAHQVAEAAQPEPPEETVAVTQTVADRARNALKNGGRVSNRIPEPRYVPEEPDNQYDPPY